MILKKYVAFPIATLLLAIGSILYFTSIAHAADKADNNNDNGDKIETQDVRQEHGKYHARVCTALNAGDIGCHARVVTDQKGSPIAGTLPAGLSPSDFHSAYTSATTFSGTKKQIIAIVDAYDHPNIYNDLKTYSTTFGIPVLPQCNGSIASSLVPCFQKISQQGTTKYPSVNASWALEIALDVEAAHAMCQNCGILLVEASSNSYTNLMTAVDRAILSGATVVSNSYGSSEFSGETAYDSHFNKSGVAITFSSGDAGYGASYPASSPYVTAVGGTTLTLGANKSYVGETAWSGSGSGCSAFESKSPWQHDAGCAKRTVADVSAVADPNTGAAVYDSVRYSGRSGWFQVGGTSLSAPIIAGVYALSGNTAGAANAIPYANVTSLHDVMSGNNGLCGGSYLCTALLGYDGPTGLGTPNGLTAF